MISNLLVTGLIPPILRRSSLRPLWRKLIYDTVSSGGEDKGDGANGWQLIAERFFTEDTDD